MEEKGTNFTESHPYLVVTDWHNDRHKSQAIVFTESPVWNFTITLKPLTHAVSLDDLSSYPPINVECWGKSQANEFLAWFTPSSALMDYPVGSFQIDLSNLLQLSEQFEVTRWIPLQPVKPVTTRFVGSIRVMVKGVLCYPELDLPPLAEARNLPRSTSVSQSPARQPSEDSQHRAAISPSPARAAVSQSPSPRPLAAPRSSTTPTRAPSTSSMHDSKKIKRKPKEVVIANQGDPKDGFVINRRSPSASPSDPNRVQFDGRSYFPEPTSQFVPSYGATATRVATSMLNSLTEVAKEAVKEFSLPVTPTKEPVPRLNVTSTSSSASQLSASGRPKVIGPSAATKMEATSAPKPRVVVSETKAKVEPKPELSHILFPRPQLDSKLPSEEKTSSASRSHSRSLSRSRSMKITEITAEKLQEFKSKYNKITFVVEEAKNIDTTPASRDVFVTVKDWNGLKHKSQIAPSTPSINPSWNYQFEIDDIDVEECPRNERLDLEDTEEDTQIGSNFGIIRLSVWDWGRKNAVFLGHCYIDVPKYLLSSSKRTSTSTIATEWFKLEPSNVCSRKYVGGNVKMTMIGGLKEQKPDLSASPADAAPTVEPMEVSSSSSSSWEEVTSKPPPHYSRLRVTIKQGRNLHKVGGGPPDTYLVITDWIGKEHISKVIELTSNPVWNLDVDLEPLDGEPVSPEALRSYGFLKLECWSKGTLQDDLLGWFMLDFSALSQSENSEARQWVSLFRDPKNSKTDNTDASIEVIMKGEEVAPHALAARKRSFLSAGTTNKEGSLSEDNSEAASSPLSPAKYEPEPEPESEPSKPFTNLSLIVKRGKDMFSVISSDTFIVVRDWAGAIHNSRIVRPRDCVKGLTNPYWHLQVNLSLVPTPEPTSLREDWSNGFIHVEVWDVNQALIGHCIVDVAGLREPILTAAASNESKKGISQWICWKAAHPRDNQKVGSVKLLFQAYRAGEEIDKVLEPEEDIARRLQRNMSEKYVQMSRMLSKDLSGPSTFFQTAQEAQSDAVSTPDKKGTKMYKRFTVTVLKGSNIVGEDNSKNEGTYIIATDWKKRQYKSEVSTSGKKGIEWNFTFDVFPGADWQLCGSLKIECRSQSGAVLGNHTLDMAYLFMTQANKTHEVTTWVSLHPGPAARRVGITGSMKIKIKGWPLRKTTSRSSSGSSRLSSTSSSEEEQVGAFTRASRGLLTDTTGSPNILSEMLLNSEAQQKKITFNKFDVCVLKADNLTRTVNREVFVSVTDWTGYTNMSQGVRVSNKGTSHPTWDFKFQISSGLSWFHENKERGIAIESSDSESAPGTPTSGRGSRPQIATTTPGVTPDTTPSSLPRNTGLRTSPLPPCPPPIVTPTLNPNALTIDCWDNAGTFLGGFTIDVPSLLSMLLLNDGYELRKWFPLNPDSSNYRVNGTVKLYVRGWVEDTSIETKEVKEVREEKAKEETKQEPVAPTPKEEEEDGVKELKELQAELRALQELQGDIETTTTETEHEEAQRREDEEKKQRDEEAKRKQEEKARIKAEEKKRQEEEEDRLRKETELKLRLEEEKKQEEERLRKAARQRQEDERRKQEEEEASRKAEEERIRQKQEEKQRQEEEERKRREEEEKQRQEETKLQEEETEARRQEERIKREEEERRKAEEEERQRQEEEKQRLAEEQTARRQEEERIKREEEEYIRKAAKEAEARRQEEERIKREEEERIRKAAEEEKQRQAEIKRQEEEAEARRQEAERLKREAEEQQRKTEEERQRKEEEERTRKEEEERIRKAEEEAERQLQEAEKRRQEEEGAKRKQEEEAEARRQEEERIKREEEEWIRKAAEEEQRRDAEIKRLEEIKRQEEEERIKREEECRRMAKEEEQQRKAEEERIKREEEERIKIAEEEERQRRDEKRRLKEEEDAKEERKQREEEERQRQEQMLKERAVVVTVKGCKVIGAPPVEPFITIKDWIGRRYTSTVLQDLSQVENVQFKFHRNDIGEGEEAIVNLQLRDAALPEEGRSMIDLRPLFASLLSSSSRNWRVLSTKQKKKVGEVDIELQAFQKDREGRERKSLRSQPQGKYKRFLLIVERGRDLASTNSYVTAKDWQEESHKSHVRPENTTEPIWDFNFSVFDAKNWGEINLLLWSSGEDFDDFLGHACLNLPEILQSSEASGWVSLNSHPQFPTSRVSGDIFVHVRAFVDSEEKPVKADATFSGLKQTKLKTLRPTPKQTKIPKPSVRPSSTPTTTIASPTDSTPNTPDEPKKMAARTTSMRKIRANMLTDPGVQSEASNATETNTSSEAEDLLDWLSKKSTSQKTTTRSRSITPTSTTKTTTTNTDATSKG